VTGAFNPYLDFNPNPQPPNPPVVPNEIQKNQLRRLAQLAVNMVDFIDPDDYMTAFNWGSVGNAAFADPKGQFVGEWVFGTELPRLLLNELYAEYFIDQGDPRNYFVSVWAELHNPMQRDPRLIDEGAAILQVPEDQGYPFLPARRTWPVYKIVLTKPDPGLRKKPENVLGDPDPQSIHQQVGGGVPAEANDFTHYPPMQPPRTDIIQPSNGNYDGGPRVPADPNNPNSPYEDYPEAPERGWYVIGPSLELPRDPKAPQGTPPTARGTLKSPGMRYQDQRGAMNEEPRPPSVLLRRLAVPHLPPNPEGPGAAFDPNLPYNPYITVDYVEMQGGQQGGQQVNMLNNGDPIVSPMQQRASWGRSQVYAAFHTYLKRQKLVTDEPKVVPHPQHTFFRHNSVERGVGLKEPPNPDHPDQTLFGRMTRTGVQGSVRGFFWLTHLDRQLTTPLELLHVSAYKPHELTQQFMVDDNNNGIFDDGERYQHLAPWFGFRLSDGPVPPEPADPAQGQDQDDLRHLPIYRFLEFVECRPLSQWDVPLPRRAGRININTIWDREIFHSLVDLPANQAQVDAIWSVLQAMRDGGFPFWSLSVSPLPGVPPTPNNGALGFQSTWLRHHPDPNMKLNKFCGWDQPRLLELLLPQITPQNIQQGDHPAERIRLLSKISNNLTTRSNVFAVWITVGFFEVDAQGRLGAEVGKADGRQVRHRMFAIVDRSVHDFFSPIAQTGPYPYAHIDPRKGGTLPILNPPPPVPPSVLYWSIIE
jgi:hypothetical protein